MFNRPQQEMKLIDFDLRNAIPKYKYGLDSEKEQPFYMGRKEELKIR